MKTLFSFQNLIVSFSATIILVMNMGMVCAQNVSDEHLDSAKKAINAIHATDQFDSFFSLAARDLKNELINNDPNLATEISEIVDREVLVLVKRYADLEKEIALIYAKYFTREELNKITEFYNSNVGKKFLTAIPNIARDAYSAFELWRSVIEQDLVKNVEKELSKIISLNNSVSPVKMSSPISSK
ncbi:DUF2059 domain-containing protein [Bartonella sp. F02]|uniref:DUF2059 domain-containing protein n=1 Tax=Bartonella sp. F02 TaxID=2967262 RepID=UPI0022A95D7F|nr:DUF2059 domain-containing protein [Bartonella sp. F02]MCZ2328348.1 DUF2059 domain-containing protein [Bartonella sp. F02]